MVQLIFVIHILATFFSFGICLVLQALHFPMLRYIGPYQYPIYYEKQKMKLSVLTFPVFSLEVFTSVIVMITFFAKGEMTEAKQNSFFVYLSTIIILLLIHLITFYFIKPSLRKLLKTWDEKTLKELKGWNLGRTLLWLARIIILF